MRANERHLRIDFDSPGAAFNFGAVAAQERELKHREDTEFLRRAIKPSVCSQLPIRTAQPSLRTLECELVYEYYKLIFS